MVLYSRVFNGGFDLAAEWMGWENVFHCEWKEFNQRVLKYYWPNATSYTDITKTDFSIHRGTIDILTGGFPCQPYSVSGKRKGKDDYRHLWPEMFRAVREIQPPWVIGENVRGLVNWNRGLVFEEVQSQMEAEGYEVQPFLLPACGVNAPHERYRIWFIAYSNSNDARRRRYGKIKQKEGGCKSKEEERKRIWPIVERALQERDASNTASGINPLNTYDSGMGREREQDKRNGWLQFPIEHPVCDGNDGVSTQLDGITFPKWRTESIMAGGNAIVPQVAYEIFKAINQMKGF